MTASIRQTLVSRVGMLALVLAIAGAPVMLQACQFACAWATSSGDSHSCHEQATPPSGSQVAPIPHLCGHPDGLPSASITDSQIAATSVPVAVVIDEPGSLPTPAGLSHGWPFHDSAGHEPIPSRLANQLRI